MTINPPEDTIQDNVVEIAPKFSFQSFRESQFEFLGNLWDESLLLSTNFINLLKESVVIPHADLQLPIIAAYALTPSAMATIVPLLFVQGKKGSGKSILCSLIAALHNVPVMSAATTFAALRNHFNSSRWEQPEICRGEKNTCLLLDNVNRDTLNNENLYTMLLNGYNRKTDIISISKGNGENMEFRVFGLKVLSSIHPVYTQSKYSELARRCVVVKCKPFEEFTIAEKESIEIEADFTISDKIDIENYDLSILHNQFKEFWRDESNLIQYTMLKRQFGGRKKPFKLPKVINGARWTISLDLLVTGIVTGIWDNPDEGVEALGNYWQWNEDNIMKNDSALHKVLSDFIDSETRLIDKANKEFGSEVIPKEINPDKLKKHVTWASSKGMLDVMPTPSIVSTVMLDLGWRLDKGSNNNICWVQSLK